VQSISLQLRGFERWGEAAGLSPQTRRLRRHYLTKLAAKYPRTPLVDLTGEQLAEFLACSNWAPETRKSARTSVRAFYSWAVENDLIDKDPSRKLPLVRVPRGRPRPAPHAVLTKALALADQRGRLMLLLAALAGLRRGEIAQVHTDHIGADDIRVKGKGGAVRHVPLHPLLRVELEKVDWKGYLFPGQIHGHLSPGHVGVLMRRMLGPGWSGHALRHKFATGFFNASKDILLTQQMLGHSKPETTARYVQVDLSSAAQHVASL
jgi:integrase